MNIKDIVQNCKRNYLFGIIAVLVATTSILGIVIYQKQKQYAQEVENNYNMAFYELVDYVQNVESFLAKSLISNSPEHGAETLTNVWREANLASTYLSQLPVQNNELLNTQKFLNQVSDYSYTLSRKNIYNEPLTDEELNNLKQLHDYSLELKNTLGQLGADIADGTASWKNFTQGENIKFAQQVSNMSGDLFKNINKNFEEYAGLIYDGAFSEQANVGQMKFIKDKEEINQEIATQKVKEFIGENKIEEIIFNDFVENGNIPSYDFSVKVKDDDNYFHISISQKGGQVILMNHNRNVEAEVISQDEANEIGKKYLASKGFPDMKETYYLKQAGIVTINYAYFQDGKVTMYPDLIKLKVALDNGEIVGIETTGYLNSHTIRDISNVKITKEEAKKTINKELDIQSEGLAMIPTEWKTEILCWEFKGKVDGSEFLVYINAENGREEDILVIVNTPDGTLTM